jgi:hypothetical protein
MQNDAKPFFLLTMEISFHWRGIHEPIEKKKQYISETSLLNGKMRENALKDYEYTGNHL